VTVDGVDTVAEAINDELLDGAHDAPDDGVSAALAELDWVCDFDFTALRVAETDETTDIDCVSVIDTRAFDGVADNDGELALEIVTSNSPSMPARV
jgi:hypothetical protein